MKRRFQKIAALMLVGAMAGTLVTGCGGSSSGNVINLRKFIK